MRAVEGLADKWGEPRVAWCRAAPLCEPSIPGCSCTAFDNLENSFRLNTGNQCPHLFPGWLASHRCGPGAKMHSPGLLEVHCPCAGSRKQVFHWEAGRRSEFRRFLLRHVRRYSPVHRCGHQCGHKHRNCWNPSPGHSWGRLNMPCHEACACDMVYHATGLAPARL